MFENFVKSKYKEGFSNNNYQPNKYEEITIFKPNTLSYNQKP